MWEVRSEPIGGMFYEVFKKDAFKSEGKDIRSLWNHDANIVLGRTTSETLRTHSDDTGQYFELDLPDNSWGQFAYDSIKRRDVTGASFGFSVVKDEWEDGDMPTRTITEAVLYEISPTPFPAYEKGSDVAIRSFYNKHRPDKREYYELYLKTIGGRK